MVCFYFGIYYASLPGLLNCFRPERITIQVLIPVFGDNLCVLFKLRIKNNWQNLVAALSIQVFIIS
ncbi:hypothetical protein FH5T_07225 [Draconibacterium orientale]|uniref:Uncharacterized protein n=1 Tax=Draconibacterium orientale TaxID=1168034 RepID=A0ABM5QDH2_9BACT|nr:hypothetical protein FH5T_07225 [Draconibacterium orientale]